MLVPKLVPPETGARVPKASSQLPGFVVLYLNQPVVNPPFGFAEPLRVADVDNTFIAALVVTDGADSVVEVEVLVNEV